MVCHHSGAMVTKLTLRLPEPVALRLREQSRAAGLSINETAVRALLRGLGDEAPDADWRMLGDLVEVPPTRRYDPEEIDRLRGTLSPGARGIVEELDWVRGDRE